MKVGWANPAHSLDGAERRCLYSAHRRRDASDARRLGLI